MVLLKVSIHINLDIKLGSQEIKNAIHHLATLCNILH